MSTSTPTHFERLPEVDKYLQQESFPAFVGGRELAATSGATVATHDPGSGQHLGEIHDLDAVEVDRAVDIATAAFPAWSMMPFEKRSELLLKFADVIEQRKPVLAQIDALDAGKLESQAQGDVQNLVDTLRYFVKLAGEVKIRTPLDTPGYEAWIYKQPWGACGFIFPWNFPLLLVGWGISPALAAGNTVVIKPAEDTSLSTLYLARLAKEAGIPDGVVNVVTGRGETAGAAMSKNPRLKRMSFTGSPEVGRLVGEACGRNLVPVKLELGGKGAAVVFDDVDVDLTARDLVQAITFHSGQVCCDATRWVIHQDIYDAFVSRCVELLKDIRIGHPLDARSEMGPVVNAKQCQRVLGYLQKGIDEGAECLLEGGPATVEGLAGHYVKPALLAGSFKNIAARDEIFGPVAFLTSFSDEQQAIELANDTDYGLANSVWTKDPLRAARVAEAMKAGNSWINAHNVFAQGVPYGGINKSGMGGGVLSKETLMDYYRNTSVVRPLK